LKMRIAALTILCLALAAVPALAYENGPINGTTDAWTINFGYIVSDSYVSDSSTVTGFSFGVWEFPGDVLSSVDWSITSAENGGTTFGSGTASGKNLTDQFISTNQFGYDIDLITVSGLNVSEVNGATYWLNLQNAAVPSGDPVFWDENSGAGCKSNGCPSKASESAVGTIASEAFTIGGSGTTPEPSSIMLFGSGILGLAGVLRRKLF
jgi:opacity protein-like surface antigen